MGVGVTEYSKNVRRERARIVAWLRETPYACGIGIMLSIESAQDIARLACAIESTEHWLPLPLTTKEND